MSDPRPSCDVVIVGLGWAGSVMAEDLARAGLNVVAIERGAWRDTSTDFAPNVDADELRWDARRAMLRPPSAEALTFRNKPDEEALPVRDWSCFEFGFNVGGAGTHWAAMAWRFTPYDFQPYNSVVKRYGKAQFTEGLQVQDWGVTYDDLEPYYDRFEKIAGVSGKAGMLNGEVVEGGNPFEGNRTNDFPMPPLESTRLIDMFDEGAKKIGLHPFRVPAGNASRPYVNSLGLRMGPCSYCGYCLYYGCGNWSKSSPQACVLPALMKHKTFTLITNAEVTRVNLAEDKRTATGVTYIDEHGVAQVQPAKIVILTAFQMDNVRLMLLSGIGTPYNHATGEGTVGRNYCFQTVSGANLFFEDEKLNTFAGAGALSQQVDDWNGDNFDHTGKGFIGGAGILVVSRGARPIGNASIVPPGTPQWGSEWKKGVTYAFQNNAGIFGQGTSYSHKDCFLDLDPVYKDANGNPLLRVTFDYNENDRRSAQFVMERSVEIGKAMGAKIVLGTNSATGNFTPYDFASNHTIGGAVMGEDPKTSALNRFLQSWDVHNTFVVGASAFPNNAGYNPTSTVGALALWACDAIKDRYLKSPGPLVQA